VVGGTYLGQNGDGLCRVRRIPFVALAPAVAAAVFEAGAQAGCALFHVDSAARTQQRLLGVQCRGKSTWRNAGQRDGRVANGTCLGRRQSRSAEGRSCGFLVEDGTQVGNGFLAWKIQYFDGFPPFSLELTGGILADDQRSLQPSGGLQLPSNDGIEGVDQPLAHFQDGFADETVLQDGFGATATNEMDQNPGWKMAFMFCDGLN
jgi:hypothetical protein